MKVLHFVTIFDKGTVIDYISEKHKVYENEYILELPNSRDYFGYATDNEEIMFIHSDTRKSVTSYSITTKKFLSLKKTRRSPWKMGYSNYPKSSYIDFKCGVLTSKGFWTFGGYHDDGQSTLFFISSNIIIVMKY